MKVQYIGPALDYSGYGEACRHDIGALLSQNVELTLRVPRYTREQTDYDELGKVVANLEDKPLDYYYKILHVTPDQFSKYYENGKYHIGRVFWETDKLPPIFAEQCLLMDEIWTGSEFNKQAIIKAGVDKPIYVIPEAINTDIDIEKIKPYKSKADKTFSFYSIFEWTERKNPDALLRAYWKEFTKNDNVSLVIKTFLDDFSVAKRRDISQAIGAIKSALKQDYYAPVYLYRELMDRKQIYRLHKTFNCFISAHRGEGWGIPQMEAMLMGNPIISTNLGGIHEYLIDNKDALLIPYTFTPVTNTRNTQWYLFEQNWGQIQVQDLQNRMRWVYAHKKQASEIGHNGHKTVKGKFNFNAVGKLMLDRLQLISAGDWK